MVSARKHAFIALSLTSLIATGCSGSSGTGVIPRGGEGENCNADTTCNAGLTCVVDLCVSSGTDAGTHDATLLPDARTGVDAPTHEAAADAKASATDTGMDATGRDAAGLDASDQDAATSDASPQDARTDDATDGAICGKLSTLHPPKLDAGPGSIYCPFSAVTDGGGNAYCTGGTEHCCETPAGSATPSACEPLATACATGSVDWGCEDPVVDCANPATPVCCAPGASIGLGTAGCGNFAHTMKSTVCVAAGSCTGVTMCTSTAECPTGQTCTAFVKAGNQVGGCM
jgi:hypothetical protein